MSEPSDQQLTRSAVSADSNLAQELEKHHTEALKQYDTTKTTLLKKKKTVVRVTVVT